MAIVMIQGPQHEGANRMPDGRVQEMLARRARQAGQVLEHYRCGSEAQLVERLARIDRGQADIILLDPGRRAGDRLESTLGALDVPYIEVHADSHDAPEPVLPDGAGPRVALVNGYAAHSYTLAMSLALEQLGCAESENDVDVGT
ncbi:type 2 periplasmic-binding domain-containing protein [Lysobacter humi (ex Lee et al. 2017)]